MHGFSKSPRRKLQGQSQNGFEGLSATLVADGLHRQKVEKNCQENQPVIEAEKGKNRLSEKPRGLPRVGARSIR